MGTSAHSFTLLHDSEKEAFEAQIASMGPDTTLLVDTYDIPAAVKMAVELTGGKVAAVRIDSGDLGSTAVEVRRQLDELGAKQTKIVVTSDLDEYTIAALAAAPVDRFGVGTSLVTGSGHPTAGFVYKLVAHTDGAEWTEVAKTSKAKTNRGGEKIASRLIESGTASAELIGSDAGRLLQVDLMSEGQADDQYLGQMGVLAAKAHHLDAKAELPKTALRLSKGEPAIPTIFS
jgi:nicotinate phosphoribosyltransferase